MGEPPDEFDPLADLKLSLEEEGFEPPSVAAPARPAVAPPPLPPKLPPKPVKGPASGAVAPLQTPAPAAPAHRPAGGRGADDPFGEPPDPRPPRGGSPEEKLEYYRTLLKNKEDTLARARPAFAERGAELEKLRAAVATLEAQLVESMSQAGRHRDLSEKLSEMENGLEREKARADALFAEVSDLTQQLGQSEDDRKDLSRALAEVEAQVPNLSDTLASEQRAKAQLAEELAALQRALELSEDRQNELAARNSEVEGSLEAIGEQYQGQLLENERLQVETERLTSELTQRSQEAEAATSALSEQKAELSSAQRQVAAGEEKAADAIEAARQELEAERTQAARSDAELAQVREQLLAQDEELAALRAAHEQAATQRQQWDEEREAAETRLQQLTGTVEQLSAQLEQERLDEEQGTQTLAGELNESNAQRVEAQGRLEALSEHVSKLEKELQGERSAGGASALRKARDELMAANRKAIEASSQLQTERREKAALLARAEKAERDRAQLAERLALAERKVEPPRAAAAKVEPPTALVAERDRLQGEVAALKKKLVTAENALELAASLKAKLTRLEAQLKTTKK